MSNPGFKPAPVSGDTVTKASDAASARWAKSIAEAVNRVLGGKMNAVLPVTLAANAATTTVIDARIGVFSALLLQPVTANAAAALGAPPYIIPTLQNSGSVVLNHVNNAQADKTFNLVILG